MGEKMVFWHKGDPGTVFSVWCGFKRKKKYISGLFEICFVKVQHRLDLVELCYEYQLLTEVNNGSTDTLGNGIVAFRNKWNLLNKMKPYTA